MVKTNVKSSTRGIKSGTNVVSKDFNASESVNFPIHEDVKHTIESRELELFIENDGDLYRQQFMPIVKNLMRKIKKDSYDSEKAIKLFGYLAENGAKKYNKDVNNSSGNWFDMFSKTDIKLVATSLRNTFEQDVKDGNYDDLDLRIGR